MHRPAAKSCPDVMVAARRTLTVKHDGKDSTFQINDRSEVMKGKSKADASALAASAGQTVKVEYVMDGSTKVAEKTNSRRTFVERSS